MTLTRSNRVLVILGLAAFGCMGFAAPQGDPINRVRWLTGCWEAVSSQRTAYEQWTAPRARAMFGTGRTFRGDSLIQYEFVALRQKGAQLAYEAHPSGQSGATFFSIVITDSSVTFENFANDFPTTVGYNRRGADSLMAWISGPRGGTTSRIEFPYQRVRCDDTSRTGIARPRAG